MAARHDDRLPHSRLAALGHRRGKRLSAFVAVVDFVISAWLVNKLIDAPWQAYVRMLAPTIAAAAISGVAALWLYDRLPFARAAWNLLSAGMILVILYAALAWLVDPQFRGAARSLTGQGIRLLRRRLVGGQVA
jgi:hypothetical protein